MHVAEDAERIRCPYCGTEYVLKSQCNEKNPVRIINYGGRGALFQSYIPAEWDYRVFDDNDSISTLATVCKDYSFSPRICPPSFCSILSPSTRILHQKPLFFPLWEFLDFPQAASTR